MLTDKNLHLTFSLHMILGLTLFSGCNQSDPNHENTMMPDPSLYSEHVRTTEFQSPEEERNHFIVPEGFKVTLFASEPDITKPINMEFDDRGRLWVTQSSEYPIAAGEGQGNDKISILEDTDGDGRADQIDDFVTGLNIPIGIMPMLDGAIAYSIPNLYYFKDKNSDNRSDGAPGVLLGPFGHKDTHGMINNLARGYDGWIYACHGFTNTSTIAGTDADSISMTSGNTFRFTVDGNRVEQTTYGRVNPFGYAFDEWGYLYSADCHSKPIYQLIPQGNYPHFGKKPPALGFAPEMMDYNLGSTALAGLELYTADQFPEEYQNCFYSGDVVTCRIDRNAMIFEGSTPIAQKREPLLVSKDPWFRPVDVKMGPDGALYVADFYNKIIGHYEVSLDHEGRDRTSGRIWRISYEGKPDTAETLPMVSSPEYYIGQLADSNLKTRMDAADMIVDIWGNTAVDEVKSAISDMSVDKYTFIHGLWILQRLGGLENNLLNRALRHPDPMVQVHGIRILKEYPDLPSQYEKHIMASANNSPNPHVRRVSAEVLGHFTSAKHIPPLIDLYRNTPNSDSHLKYTALLGIQLNLKNPEVMEKIVTDTPLEEPFKVLYKAMLDIPSKPGADYLLDHAIKFDFDRDEKVKMAKYLARSIDSDRFGEFVKLMKRQFVFEKEFQFRMILAIEEGIAERGNIESTEFVKWEREYTKAALSEIPEEIRTDEEKIPEQWIWAIEKSGAFDLHSFENTITRIFTDAQVPVSLRTVSAKAMLQLNPEANFPLLTEAYQSPSESAEFKTALTPYIHSPGNQDALDVLYSQISVHNYPLQTAIAIQLAQSREGIELLLTAVDNQNMRMDILLENAVQAEMQNGISDSQNERLKELKEKFGDEIENRNQVIRDRIDAFVLSEEQIPDGKEVFEKNCITCHQVKGQGQLIGPQLDGIGHWGKKALIEKILDPNRNISESFRNFRIELTEGKTLNGLFRREEGETIVYADVNGEEFRINKKDIEEQIPTGTTLMPDQFRNTITEEDFYKLINYLLSVK